MAPKYWYCPDPNVLSMKATSGWRTTEDIARARIRPVERRASFALIFRFFIDSSQSLA